MLGHRTPELTQVRPMLEQFVSCAGPAFLEVLIDQTAHVYPMVGPGMGYKDMIVGRYITPREQTEGKLDITESF